MSFWVAFALGSGAAFLAEFLPIHALRYTPRDQWPGWLTSGWYWLISIAGFGIGGAVAGGYATQTEMTWYLAANVGAAWPSIINGLARSVPPLQPPPDSTN